jgi:NADPH-dependent 2,4-dienoyl-CoA reductase/sulfur reductase-like enzyme/nitrite reductase/ring-hydroxylating ferredoxin subunit
MGSTSTPGEPLPDLTAGVPANDISAQRPLVGRVGDQDVLVTRVGDRFFAVRAYCTHYRGRLVDGTIVGSTVRCPLHHACFDLETGEALRAPALDPLTCWRVETRGDQIFVNDKLPAAPASKPPAAPASIVIIGGGAAGLAAADMLRRYDYPGAVTIISADEDPPVDRPNLSKDYLAGEAQDDWIPLWPPELYAEKRVELVLKRRVTAIDAPTRTVTLDDGTRREYGALLIATGADPVHLPIPGADGPRVHYLRSFADSRAVIAKIADAKHAVVVGASFIGLEVAASLRARGIAVDVVAPENVPLDRVMGTEVGRFIQSLHEDKGVVFHLGQTVTRVDDRRVTLSGGSTLDADIVVMGVGVRPALALAEKAGIAVDRGISVNEHMETSVAGIFAAGDIARWPDPHTAERIRVEHWVVAQRQGQVAARNMLGYRDRFDAVPFFWSQHYDVTIRYVRHAERWDSVRIDGSLEKQDATVSFIRGGRPLAVATIGRDRASLQAESEMESATGPR